MVCCVEGKFMEAVTKVKPLEVKVFELVIGGEREREREKRENEGLILMGQQCATLY